MVHKKEKTAKTRKEYWMGIIGPVKSKDIPWGGDAVLRMPLRDAFIQSFGSEEVCVSGWGIDEKRYEILRSLHLIPTDVLEKMVKSYRKKIEKNDYEKSNYEKENLS